MSGPDLMPPALRERLFSLRCRAKRGEHMSPEDMEFFSEMLRKYPIQYRAMNAEIHEATKSHEATKPHEAM